MTPAEFQQWAESLGLRSDPQIADALGVHRNSARKYRHEGTDNRCVLLAMAALAAEWNGEAFCHELDAALAWRPDATGEESTKP